MVILRNVSPDAIRLLKQLDNTVNGYRAEGLRCFVVLLSDSAQRDSAQLQTVAFDEKLDIPLTLTTEPLSAAATKNITADASVTVVLYDRLKVIERFAFRIGECDEQARESILNSAERLARGTQNSPRIEANEAVKAK